jgi:hypothetical protein
MQKKRKNACQGHLLTDSQQLKYVMRIISLRCISTADVTTKL